MADQKISELTAVGTPAGTDLLETVQGGNNFKMTISQLLSMGSVSGTFSGLTVNGIIALTAALEVVRASASLVAMSAEITGDTGPRVKVLADGKIEWGPGNDSFDIAFERLSSAVLKLTAALEVHGDLTVDRIGDVVDAVLNLKGDAGENRLLKLLTGTSLRWALGADSASEGGSNAGSDLNILAYSDAAALIGTALKITRATMDTVLGAKLNVTGDFSVASTKCTVAASDGDIVTLGTIAASLGAWFRDSALALSATTGHFYVPGCNGIPTGVPATKTGQVALQYDTANDDLYVYNGAWVKVALT